MLLRKRRTPGSLAVGAAALILALGALTACSSGGAPEAASSPVASDTPAADTATATASPSPTPAPPPVVEADHVGQSSEQASAALTQQGFVVAFSDTAGHVLPSEQGWSVVAQQPAAGTSVAPGAVVTLVLSPPVVAADHVGETSDQAIAELTGQGLLVSFADASGAVLPSEQGWSVVGQNPAAGASLHAGSTVQLILSPPAPPPSSDQDAPSTDHDAPSVAPGGGATALCNDGTLSYSAHHQGTCSHHGGVAVWYK